MTSGYGDITKLVSLSKNRQLSQFSSMFNIDDWWRYHADSIVENWYFYLGFHNLFLQRFEAEEERDYIRRVEEATVENQIRPIVDLMVSYLYGSSESIRRYVMRGEKPDDTLNDILKTVVWNAPKAKTVDDSKALNTLVTGYTLIRRKLIDVNTGNEFPTGTSDKTKVKYGVIQKTPLDSEYCIPLPYINEHSEIDPSRFGAVLMIYDYDTSIANKTVMQLVGRPTVKQQVVEFIDDQVWLKFVRKDIGNPSSQFVQTTVHPGTPYENRNMFGDVSIPFTLYRNTGDPFYIEGDSEVPAIKSLNTELNELGNGDKNTIRYHQYPILVGRDGAQLPNDFRRTKNAVVELDRKGAYFEYLTWEGKLEASETRQETLRRVMSNTSGLSLISRGFLKEIGQIRSGPPLKALFTSDRAKMSRKFTHFAECESSDMRADLLFLKKMTGRNDIDLDNTVTFHADFDKDFLGIDRLLEEEIRTLRLQTEPLDEIVKDLHPDWDEAKIKEAVKELEKIRPAKTNQQRMQSSDKKGLQQDRTPQ
jgi:hypothetical protein